MNNFPSMDDLEFLKSVNALPVSDVKYYLSVGVVNAEQAKQLGYVAPQAKPSAAPKPNVTSKPSPVANNVQPKSNAPQSNEGRVVGPNPVNK